MSSDDSVESEFIAAAFSAADSATVMSSTDGDDFYENSDADDDPEDSSSRYVRLIRTKFIQTLSFYNRETDIKAAMTLPLASIKEVKNGTWNTELQIVLKEGSSALINLPDAQAHAPQGCLDLPVESVFRRR